MKLTFTKMQGIGNDFVVFNAIDQHIDLTPDQYQFIADRRFGIGCDQILLVEPPCLKNTDFHYRIFNADGSEVEQCGNGARCFARFVMDQGLTHKHTIRVGTASGSIQLSIKDNGWVLVNMGAPLLKPADIPFIATTQAITYPIELAEQSLSLSVISMGNPHAVLMVDDLNSIDIKTIATQIQQHPAFPQGVNVGFMQINSRTHIQLRVYERGSGETLGCGTGACAAMVAGRLQGVLDDHVQVQLTGGYLHIRWSGDEQDAVWMSGPATSVFEGQIEL